MPHPIGTQISEFYFSQKTSYFSNQMKQKLCVYIAYYTYIHKLLLLLSENKREEK